MRITKAFPTRRVMWAVLWASTAAPALAQNPRIDRVEPNPIPPKAAVTVRILGANFTLRSQVEWSGTLLPPVTYISTSELRVSLAADSAPNSEPGVAYIRIFEQRCTDANQAYCQLYPDLYSNMVAVPIQAPPPSVCNLSFAISEPLNGLANVDYSRTITLQGGIPPYRILTTAYAQAVFKEAGLEVTNPTDDTLLISGTLPKAGTYELPLSGRDSGSCIINRVVQFTLTDALAMRTEQLADACVGQPYRQLLEATGGVAPYRWYAAAGTLPAGLRIDRDQGTLTGTPSKPPGDQPVWSFYPRLQVDDSAPAPAAVDRVFPLSLYPALTVSTDRVEDATFGVNYSQAFSANGCKEPYQWALDPASLRLNGQSVTPAQLGDQAGVVFSALEATLRAEPPKRLGTVDFALLVTDGNGGTTRKEFRLTIREPRLVITTASLPDGTVGLPYSQKLQVQNGAAAYVWKAAGALPDGLTLSDSPQPTAEVALKGTPRKPGVFKFQVSVTDRDGFTAPGPKEFQLRIREALAGTPKVNVVDAAGRVMPEVIQDLEGEVRLQLRVRNGYSDVALSGTLGLGEFELAPETHANPGFASAYQLVRLAVAGSGKSIEFEVPAGGELAQFLLPAAGGRAATRQDSIELQTGNVAGNITVAVTRLAVTGIDITPKPAATSRLTIPALPPQITAGCVAQQPGLGYHVTVTGYSTGRDPLEAELTVSGAAPAAGAPVTPQNLDTQLLAWYEAPESTNYGSAFTLRQNIPAEANSEGLPTVSVTLRKKDSAEAVTGKLEPSRACEAR